MVKKVSVFFLTVICFLGILFFAYDSYNFQSNSKNESKVNKNENKTSSENKAQKVVFDLKADKEGLNQFQDSQHPVIKSNDKLFGSAIESSSLQMILTDMKPTFKSDNLTEFNVKVKGKINDITNPVEFTAEDVISLVTLEDGRQIYIGHISATPINISKDFSNMSISFRKDATSDDVDVSITIGIVGNTSFAIYGKPFLYDKDYAEIENVQRQNVIGGELNEK